ncbi:citrate (pro-3S)-lyase subunit beta [Spirochaeta isovalerica]|uniref:Citrate lyase subunit beta n=1 Tax=Spirochaeta isovalerica TaxID=150 RepID=A0A841R8T1_9SPIO|nr:citrate (pro-3S)-lyase subunit beta [Spirochaeta isovalerica]MBB6480206.1 citrate lyase subunit beta/citryl-CoA lyase [Spirochaeta isovalerica]
MEKLRRTMLYVPGNNAGMVKDAHIYRSDSVMFDLEDSVSLTEKDSARLLIFNALKTLDYEGIETVVRINGLDTPFGEDDIKAMVRARPDIIRIPKAETADDILEVEKLIEREEKAAGVEPGTIKMMAAIEGPLGVINAYQIATASRRLVGIALGAEDYVTNMKTKRSPEGTEILYARSAIVTAARAAGIYALDTVYSDINNEEGFIEEVKLIKQLGFDGKSVISPRQIAPVHRIYTPEQKEIDFAVRVIAAIAEAEEKGSGVISLDGKMVDKPIVDRAQRVLAMAKASGILISEDEI